jgi:hypothetical protein
VSAGDLSFSIWRDYDGEILTLPAPCIAAILFLM